MIRLRRTRRCGVVRACTQRSNVARSLTERVKSFFSHGQVISSHAAGRAIYDQEKSGAGRTNSTHEC